MINKNYNPKYINKVKSFGKRDVTVFDKRFDYFKGILGINWSAHGTVSISEAKKFVRNLEKAIKYAESIK